MELTRTDAVFSRIAMVLFMCRNKSSRNDLKLLGTYFWKILKILAKESRPGGPPPVHEGGGVPAPWARPLPRGPHVAPPTSTATPYIRVWGEKIREKDSSRFMIWSRRQALNSLGRADLESVRGSGEGNMSPASSSTFLHHQFHDAQCRVRVIPS